MKSQVLELSFIVAFLILKIALKLSNTHLYKSFSFFS